LDHDSPVSASGQAEIMYHLAFEIASL
jgi:hypothetical protein